MNKRNLSVEHLSQKRIVSEPNHRLYISTDALSLLFYVIMLF